jgi:hypothetical protein
MLVDFVESYYDAHLYKFNPYSKSDCLYSAEIKSRDLKSPQISFDEDQVKDWKSNKYILTNANNRFAAYDQNTK